jgi:hypothetical protein
LIEGSRDLRRQFFLKNEKRIVLGDGLAFLAGRVGGFLHRCHERVVAGECFVLHPQRMPVPHRLGHLRSHHRLDPGLDVLAIGIEVHLGDALGRLEPALVLG